MPVSGGSIGTENAKLWLKLDPRSVREFGRCRYFFDTDDGDLGLVDREGQILADDATARAAALQALSHMLRDHAAAGEPRVFSTSVRDERNRLVFAGAVTLATTKTGD